MRFINHHHIEMTDTETAGAIRPVLVDLADHRLIGRHIYSPLVGTLGNKVHRPRIRQMALESVHRLVHQRGAIGEEQHPLNPTSPHQQIRESDNGAGLARACGHHHQRLALLVSLKVLSDRPDRSLLVMAIYDALADIQCRHCLLACSSLDEQG